MNALHELSHGLTSLLAPGACAGCRAALPPSGWEWRDMLCVRCADRVELLEAACRGCGAGQGPHTERDQCAACREQPRGRIVTTTALLRYRGPARSLLAQLKYRRRDPLAMPLGRDLARRWLGRDAVAAAEDLLVVPVPLHRWRRWRRGFNQAEEIARGVAEVLERPLALALRRRHPTRPLHEVPREERDRAVSGAFALSAFAPQVRARPVVLVDDIRTSGATLREAAAILHAAGADRIDALVVAR